MMGDLPIAIVDDDDVVVGAATKEEAHALGLKHRIVRVMLEDEDGNILLQKRSSTKSLYSGCWDNSASGHVDAGEDYEFAAYRELSEELGVRDVQLKKVRYYRTQGSFKGKKLNRFNMLYVGKISRSTIIVLAPEEVSEWRWFSKAEVQSLLRQHPGLCTDGMHEVFRQLYDYENHSN